MSAETIAWHEECLRNAQAYHASLLDDLQRMMDKVDASAHANLTYRFQIDRAKQAGKKSFDRDNSCQHDVS